MCDEVKLYCNEINKIILKNEEKNIVARRFLYTEILRFLYFIGTMVSFIYFVRMKNNKENTQTKQTYMKEMSEVVLSGG